MLTELRIKNFKCFREEVILPLRKLTLLTGINGKGKSTALQALLLLHQKLSIPGSNGLSKLDLNGRSTQLGTFGEIRNRDVPIEEPIEIGLTWNQGHIDTLTSLYFRGSEAQVRYINLVRFEVERFDKASPEETSRLCKECPLPEGVFLPAADPNTNFQNFPLSLSRVQHIGADRLGPQEFFARSTVDEFQRRQIGAHGEHTAELLFWAKQEQMIIDERLAIADGETLTVPDQASAWLSYLFDGGAVRVSAPHPAILTLEMNADGSAHYFRPTNLGFGYSYILPVIVAGLLATPGKTLIVENPEAHLHPLAQSRIGEFLARVSSIGVQVLVESHSEHLLNAFRLAIRDEVLSNDELSVLYFRRSIDSPVLRVTVEPNGSVVDWPQGFFDQRSQDFNRLFGE